MGTRFHLRMQGGESTRLQAAAEEAVRSVEELERLLSTWDADTPLSRLNAAPTGTSVVVEPALRWVLAEAFAWAEATGGAFHPAVGALVDAWDLRGTGRVPAPAELAAALRATGDRGFAFRAADGRAQRRAGGAWLDAGGFGKGAALRVAGRRLREAGVRRAVLDLGGQVLALAPDDDPWRVAVADPEHRDRPAAWLRVAGVSVATSGTSQRGVVVDGVRYGHILDPRTGRPAPAWGSVTVVAADALAADALATALYVMGPAEGMRWARSRGDVGVLFLARGPDGPEATWNPAMERWLERNR